MKRLCSMLALVVAAALSAAPDAFACSCGSDGRCPGAAELLPESAVAFVGVMVQSAAAAPIAVSGVNGASGAGMRFSVTESLTGTAAGSVIIYNAPDSCRFEFKEGESYLVFADAKTMMIVPCAGIATARQAASRIALLRAARDGRRAPSLLGLVVGYPPKASDSYLAMTQALNEGRPGPGRTVVARSQAGEYRVQTGTNGLYAFDTLPPGRYAVQLDPPGLTATSRSSQAYIVDVPDRGACRVDFLIPIP